MRRSICKFYNCNTTYFICALSYIDSDGNCSDFVGRCDGHITDEPRGDGGFGYDPVFCPQGYKQTFAQMEACEKNKISHRAKALKKFIHFLNLLKLLKILWSI